MNFKSRPTLLLLCYILTGFVLPYLIVLLLGRIVTGRSYLFLGVLLNSISKGGAWGIVSWLAFRKIRTSMATYLVPLGLLVIPMLFYLLSSLRYRSGNVFDAFAVWQPIKTVFVHWMGIYFLSRCFDLYLIPNGCESTSVQKGGRGISIRFLLAIMFAFAVITIIDQWITRRLSPSINDYSFYTGMYTVSLITESFALFGAGYFVVSRGRQKLIALGAIALGPLLSFCYVFWMVITSRPELPGAFLKMKNEHYLIIGIHIATAILTPFLIVGIFSIFGYRFFIARDQRQLSAEQDLSYDSILANESVT